MRKRKTCNDESSRTRIDQVSLFEHEEDDAILLGAAAAAEAAAARRDRSMTDDKRQRRHLVRSVHLQESVYETYTSTKAPIQGLGAPHANLSPLDHKMLPCIGPSECEEEYSDDSKLSSHNSANQDEQDDKEEGLHFLQTVGDLRA